MKYKETFKKITPMVLGGIITILCQFGYEYYLSRVKYIDYSITTTQDSTESLFDYNKRHLREVHVHVHNQSRWDYSDVPLYIDLIPCPGETFSIVDSDFMDHNISKESVELIDTYPSRFEGGLRRGYLIKTLNRTGPTSSGVPFQFIVRYWILSKRPLTIQVQTDKQGIELQEFNLDKDVQISFRYRILMILGCFLFLGIIFYIIDKLKQKA